VQLFVDTWGWIVLQNKREPQHGDVKSYYQDFRRAKGKVYTTDYVLDETLTLLFKRLPFVKAQAFLSKVEEAVQKGYLHLEWITPERFEQAKVLRLKFQDKPRISFTDLTSMVVMQELSVEDVLTADDHFVLITFDDNHPSSLPSIPQPPSAVCRPPSGERSEPQCWRWAPRVMVRVRAFC